MVAFSMLRSQSRWLSSCVGENLLTGVAASGAT